MNEKVVESSTELTSYRTPTELTMKHAVKLAIVQLSANPTRIDIETARRLITGSAPVKPSPRGLLVCLVLRRIVLEMLHWGQK